MNNHRKQTKEMPRIEATCICRFHSRIPSLLKSSNVSILKRGLYSRPQLLLFVKRKLDGLLESCYLLDSCVDVRLTLLHPHTLQRPPMELHLAPCPANWTIVNSIKNSDGTHQTYWVSTVLTCRSRPIRMGTPLRSKYAASAIFDWAIC